MDRIPGVGPLTMDRTDLKRDALAGDVAVVTGGAGNVGLGTARSLAWLGAKVVLADVTAEAGAAAEELINEENGPGTALFVETDVSDEASMKAMAEQAFAAFGKVDILINNAMPMSLGRPIMTSTIEQLDRQYEIAGRGTLIGIQLFVPGTMRVKNNNVNRRIIKRRIVVAAVPNDNIGFFFGCFQNSPVVDSSINNNALIHQRFILFSFLDRTLMLLKILIIRKPLYHLFGQISVRHWMADDHNPLPHLSQDCADMTRGL